MNADRITPRQTTETTIAESKFSGVEVNLGRVESRTFTDFWFSGWFFSIPKPCMTSPSGEDGIQQQRHWGFSTGKKSFKKGVKHGLRGLISWYIVLGLWAIVKGEILVDMKESLSV